MDIKQRIPDKYLYEKFIIDKLGIPDSRAGYYIPDIVPNFEELTSFAMSKGMGIEGCHTKREIVEKLLYEYGITTQEIKQEFSKYLGVDEMEFIRKYKISQSILEELKKKHLVRMVHVNEKVIFLDAEFYFSEKKFKTALQIIRMSKGQNDRNRKGSYGRSGNE